MGICVNFGECVKSLSEIRAIQSLKHSNIRVKKNWNTGTFKNVYPARYIYLLLLKLELKNKRKYNIVAAKTLFFVVPINFHFCVPTR